MGCVFRQQRQCVDWSASFLTDRYTVASASSCSLMLVVRIQKKSSRRVGSPTSYV